MKGSDAEAVRLMNEDLWEHKHTCGKNTNTHTHTHTHTATGHEEVCEMYRKTEVFSLSLISCKHTAGDDDLVANNV